eukprot:CAMPEP_0206431556 /NCGR_PEP_ID=MMETSP0324_2-20121206/7431_1 /ASSEMBLY_ACC=CAM_ASM_000836 /TAXON_ID=2866 /ORGANISM="Crypthecodinium cohnii, Strain Seligo" /LENGTH=156 /DNA_ID=CAMNT_0053897499 /DNA_START=137 /DNA_END=607 /DNA_ORIENTATION=+
MAVTGKADPDASPTKSPASAASLRSALRGSGKSADNDNRTDYHGNIIQKGGTHHMSFVDEHKPPQRELQEVKEVQAFKNGHGGCGCIISSSGPFAYWCLGSHSVENFSIIYCAGCRLLAKSQTTYALPMQGNCPCPDLGPAANAKYIVPPSLPHEP